MSEIDIIDQLANIFSMSEDRAREVRTKACGEIASLRAKFAEAESDCRTLAGEVEAWRKLTRKNAIDYSDVVEQRAATDASGALARWRPGAHLSENVNSGEIDRSPADRLAEAVENAVNEWNWSSIVTMQPLVDALAAYRAKEKA